VRTSYPFLTVETGDLDGGTVGQAIPASFFLAPNSPNPFNPSTKITWGIPAGYRGDVSVNIYDIGGRLVRTLYSDPAEGGDFKMEGKGRNRAAGFIGNLYRASANGGFPKQPAHAAAKIKELFKQERIN